MAAAIKTDGHKQQALTFRAPSEVITAFHEAVKRDNEMHGEEQTASRVLRNLMREYAERIASISESAEGVYAARVLKGRKGKGRKS
jgi:hypothetical protein